MGVKKIKPESRLDIALGQILRKRSATSFTLAFELLKKKDAESVHQMRVSFRRLNTLMKVFRELYPGKELKAHLQILRDILDRSGAVRENDIVLAVLEQYRSTLVQHEQKVIDLLIARKRHERVKNWNGLARTLSLLQDGAIRSEFEKFADISAPRR
jgi:CHAD domain-containing protein